MRHTPTSRSRGLLLLLAVALLLVSSIACVSAEQVEQWIAAQQRGLQAQFQHWLQEQVDRVRQDLERQAREAWDKLVADIRNRFWPPAPVITSPVDGTSVTIFSLTVEGSAPAGVTVTLLRDDKAVREVVVGAQGRWRVEGMALNNDRPTVFTAQVTSSLLPGPKSRPVKITTSATEAAVNLPRVLPELPANLDRARWMTRLALAALKDKGRPFYTGLADSDWAALEVGLQMAADDSAIHRYIDPRVNLSFDKHIVVWAVPTALSADEAKQALVETVTDVVTAVGVRDEIVEQIRQTYTELDVTQTLTEGGRTLEIKLVQVTFERRTITTYFTASRWAVLRSSLGTNLLAGAARTVGSELTKKALQLGFAAFGLAAGDSEAQKYYDLALMAFRTPDTEAKWNEWDKNVIDRVEGVKLDTNREWGLFYLGRAVYHLQLLADPYYTIPPYKFAENAAAEGFAVLTKKYVKEWAAKKAGQRLGAVIGGGAGLGSFFLATEIWDIFNIVGAVLDAKIVDDQHRPHFERFVNGQLYNTQIPERDRQPGVTDLRAGLPFRGPADLLLYRQLGQTPPHIWERGERSREINLIKILDEAGQAFLIGHRYSDIRRVGRELAEEARRYVQVGGEFRSDMRVPEGEMIFEPRFLVRQVYDARLLDGRPEDFWRAPKDAQVRVTLVDGQSWRGRVAFNMYTENGGQPYPIEYLDPTITPRFKHTVPTHYMVLEDASCAAGDCKNQTATTIELYAFDHQPGHLYAVFDPRRLAAEPGGGFRKDIAGLLVGLDGWGGPPPERPYPEKNGAATIAASSLIYGTLATMKALDAFAVASAQPAPPPIVVGPQDFAVTLGSPGTLHLFDRAGRHVGPNASGGIDLQLPGAVYTPGAPGEHTRIFVPQAREADGYVVRVEGTDNGTFTLETFQSLPGQGDVRRLAYRDVPIERGIRAELAMTDVTSPSLALGVDPTRNPAQRRMPDLARTTHVAEPIRPGFLQLNMTVIGIGVALLVLAGLLLRVRRWRRRPSGRPVTPLRVCLRCGAPAPRPDSKFCAGCGARLP